MVLLHLCPAYAIESSCIKEVSTNAVLNFFTILSGLIKEHEIPTENVNNIDEPDIVTDSFINSNRVHSQRKSSQLYCCRFSSLSKVSSMTKMARMNYCTVAGT